MKKVLIGEGGSSKIYRIWWPEKERFIVEKRSTISLKQEGIWLKKLQEFAVPQLYDLSYQNGIWRIWMEHIPGKTLEKILEEEQKDQFEQLELMESIIWEVMRIQAKYPKMAFCDLKPSNIIIGAGKKVTLIDFESVAKIGEKQECRGTKPYAAPEVIRGIPSEKSDSYSLTQILWEMLGWKKDFSYYKMIRPFLRKDITKRNGDLMLLYRSIQRKKRWIQWGNRLTYGAKKGIKLVEWVLFIFCLYSLYGICYNTM